MAKDPNQAQKSREKIKEAAIKEFAERGFYQAKISDIVTKAGFSQRTFYIYYENKEAIYKEILDDWKNGLVSLFAFGRNANGNFLGMIEKRWEEIFKFMLDNSDSTRAVYLNNPFLEEIRQELFTPFKESITWEQEEGFIKKNICIDLFVECHLATFEGLAIRYLLKGNDDYIFMAKQMAEIFVNGSIRNLRE